LPTDTPSTIDSPAWRYVLVTIGDRAPVARSVVRRRSGVALISRDSIRIVFARSEPSSSGSLPVDGVHEIYWEESGRAGGIPAVYLHGGPGGTLGRGAYRMKFDPDRFRVVGFDQRGCGRSTPRATAPNYDLTRNTTQHLIADTEALRRYLGVDRWLVNGVSWGSTPALAYAQAHPDRVLGIVLMAVTTSARSEIDWITQTVAAIYPEAWDRLGEHPPRIAVVLVGIGWNTAGADRDVVGLPVVPGPCGPVTHDLVGIGHQPGIGLDDPVSIPPVTDTGLFSVTGHPAWTSARR